MKYNLVLFTALFCVLLPLSAQAGDFVGLVGIPGIEPTGDTDLNVYINALYRLSISLAALLAVIKIVAAGAKYMLSDIVPAKEEAKKDIQGALIGLLIVIGAIIILNTVNSDLTELDLSIATTTITQGPTIQEVLAAQLRTMTELAAAENSREMVLTCSNRNIDTLPNESLEVACRRLCRDTYRGIYTDNITFGTINRDTCNFVESVANRCDPNSNWNCCEERRGGSWYPGHNMCLGPTNTPFEEISCSRGDRSSNFDCSQARLTCRGTSDAPTGRNIVSDQQTSTGSTILCSISGDVSNNIDLENESIANIVSTNNFSAVTYNSDQVNNLLSVAPQNEIRAVSQIIIPIDDMPTDDQEFIDLVSLSLRDKCIASGGTQVRGVSRMSLDITAFFCLE